MALMMLKFIYMYMHVHVICTQHTVSVNWSGSLLSLAEGYDPGGGGGGGLLKLVHFCPILCVCVCVCVCVV